MLSRKHYEAIAKIIARQSGETSTDKYEEGWDDAVELTTKSLADYFITDNPNFNREKFMKACKLVNQVK